MKSAAQQIVQRLWSYCNVLRDDGLSYPDYVEQLTYLLFLKMAYEQAEADPDRMPVIPAEYDWQSLVAKEGNNLRTHYAAILKVLAAGKGMLGIIFNGAENKIRDPAKLRLLIVDLIDKRNWSELDTDVKGDAYEGLLEKNAQDTKSGAGQYFTPRPVIQAIVECIRPGIGKTIYDPACGTCGFLLGAYDFILRQESSLTEEDIRRLRLETFFGVELVDAVTRLGAMNLLLRGIGPVHEDAEPPIVTADSLAEAPTRHYDIILTNPPFGKKSSVTLAPEDGDRDRHTRNVIREDFRVSTANKQLNFLQHIMSTLAPGGQAAVVIPDNVLFEGGAGEAIRRRLLDEYNVHTLLRLPTGIFYAQGVKANVLFFDAKADVHSPVTTQLWIYDLRTANRFSIRTNRIDMTELDDFVHCYSALDIGRRGETWTEASLEGRWRAYSYDDLVKRDKCSLDITWLKDRQDEDMTLSPDEIAEAILSDLTDAMEQIKDIIGDLQPKIT